MAIASTAAIMPIDTKISTSVKPLLENDIWGINFNLAQLALAFPAGTN